MNRITLKTGLVTTQVIHHVIIVSLATAPIWSWAFLPAYLAVLVSSVTIWRIFSHAKCPLTRLENNLRIKLGLRIIKGFVGHYYKKPFMKYISKKIGEL